MTAGRRYRVVFVDDDPAEAETFRRLYQTDELDISPLAATSARKAVEAVQQALSGDAPDLIVLDLYFPDMEEPPAQLEPITFDAARTSLIQLQRAATDAEALLMPGEPLPTSTILRTAGDILYWTQRLVHEWCEMCGQAPDGGVQLLRALRLHYPHTPVIFYSRKATVPDVTLALTSGASLPGVCPAPGAVGGLNGRCTRSRRAIFAALPDARDAPTVDDMIEQETDVRPWGRYTVLESTETYKVKRIEVLPGKRLSYQRHAHRSEHWFVVTGEGVATLDGATIAVKATSTIDVPVGVAHRIENTGPTTLVFIEVQHGESFAEEDIVRLDDDFGRAYAAAAQQVAIPPGLTPTRHTTS